MTAYRDTTEAKRSLLESFAAELRSIEARLFIPDALDAAYAPLSPPNRGWCEQRDRVMKADEERASLDEAALDGALESAEAVVAQWRLLAKDAGGLEEAMMTAADSAPLPKAPRRPIQSVLTVSNGIAPLVIDEARELPQLVQDRLKASRCEEVHCAWEVEPGVLVAPWIFHVTARREDTPYAFRFELWHNMGALLSHTIATTSIPRARRPLSIVTRGAWWKRLVADRRTLGAEAPTGDAELDDTFAMRGLDARELSPKLRTPLGVLLRCEAPEVDVRAGVASVSWRYDPEPEVLKATLAILDHLRNAPVRFSLRREPSSDDP
jgi:hypothetical protein